MMIFRGKNDKSLQKICKPDKRDLNHNSKRSENEYPLFKEFIDTSMKNNCIDEYWYRRKRFTTPGTFFFAVIFIVIYVLLFVTTLNRKLKMMLLIIGTGNR